MVKATTQKSLEEIYNKSKNFCRMCLAVSDTEIEIIISSTVISKDQRKSPRIYRNAKA